MGYRFTIREEHTCSLCDGTGSVTSEAKLVQPNTTDDPSLWESALRWITERAPTIEQTEPCYNCNGNGHISEIRDRRLEELTGKQIGFLYEAHTAREEAKWGGDPEDIDVPENPQQVQPQQHAQNPNIQQHVPNTPTPSGPTHRP